MFDEAHCILTWQHFALGFKDLKLLRQTNVVPLVFMSGSLSTEGIKLLIMEFQLEPTTIVIRGSLARPNLEFSLIVASPQEKESRLVELVKGKRALIITKDRTEPVRLGSLYNFIVFPSSMACPDEEKDRILNNWSKTEIKEEGSVLIGTSSLLMGIDIPDITLVIFWSGFYSYLDFVQGNFIMSILLIIIGICFNLSRF